MEAIATDESKEAKVGEAQSEGEGELDHHVVRATGGGTGEDKVGEMLRRRKRDHETIAPSSSLEGGEGTDDCRELAEGDRKLVGNASGVR
ncbi:hypothetical protein GW17_00044745 [Ensete ventricosum]|nr:hypothetical protein GW17_00044745 [Ensete ventricosum]